MSTQDEKPGQALEDVGTPAQDILPDRDVLMMEKTVPDYKAAGYRPADKKLLRNLLIIMFFLIAALIVLYIIVKSHNENSDAKPVDAPKDVELTT